MTLKAVGEDRPIKVGVHGTSMGGMVAAHLGRQGQVDFMMIDRSFRDLQSIPRETMHYSLPPLFKFFTMWQNPDCAKDYLYSNCYKILAYDPCDEIIADPCSLKTGISLSIIQTE